MKLLDGLLLGNKLSDDLAKFRISDDLLSDAKMLDALDKEFCADIWEQAQTCFSFNKYSYNEIESKYFANY